MNASGRWNSISGAAASTTGGVGAASPFTGAWSGPLSGASGGGITSTNTQSAGGNGFYTPGISLESIPGGGDGGNGTSSQLVLTYGSPGSGGGSCNTGARGGNGGNSGRACGGPGGGAVLNGQPSGSGGKGGDGFVEIIAYF